MRCFMTWVYVKWQPNLYKRGSITGVNRVAAGLTRLAALSLPMSPFVRLVVAVSLFEGISFCKRAGVLDMC